jgi:hypothetical protein
MTWSLVRYLRNENPGVAILRDDGTLAAPTDLKRWATLLELVEDRAQAEEVLRGLDTDGAPAVEYDALLPPLRWPRKVVCAGVNYRRHMKEMGGEIPAGGWRPFFFLKAPTTTIVGPHDLIVVRSPDEARYDWEAELAAVIGIRRPGHPGGRRAGPRGRLLRGQRRDRPRAAPPGDGPGRRVRLRLVRRQVHGQLTAAGAGHHALVPGA